MVSDSFCINSGHAWYKLHIFTKPVSYGEYLIVFITHFKQMQYIVYSHLVKYAAGMGSSCNIKIDAYIHYLFAYQMLHSLQDFSIFSGISLQKNCFFSFLNNLAFAHWPPGALTWYSKGLPIQRFQNVESQMLNSLP